MDQFLEQMAEIFEVDIVRTEDVLTEFDAWDSLTQLSIIALAGEHYGVTVSASEIRNAQTIGGLKILVESKK